jgi:4-carboxymuconolactone decarboxylase
MVRLRALTRDDLAPADRQVYDAIAARRGGVPPNYHVLLHSPPAAARMAALGAYLRFESPLPARTKALALLTTARETDGDYVWTMNQPHAVTTGLTADMLTVIRERRALTALAHEDAVIVRFTRELLTQHRIAEATFRAVQRQLGDAGVIELLLVIGYYASLSHAASALEIHPPPPSTLSGERRSG